MWSVLRECLLPEDAIEIFKRSVGDGWVFRVKYSGGVDEDAGLCAEEALSRVEEGLHVGRIGDVGSDGDGARRGVGRPGPGGFDLGDNEVGLGGGVGGVVDDEPRAEGGQVESDGSADPARGPGDYGHAVVEWQCVVLDFRLCSHLRV